MMGSRSTIGEGMASLSHIPPAIDPMMARCADRDALHPPRESDGIEFRHGRVDVLQRVRKVALREACLSEERRKGAVKLIVDTAAERDLVGVRVQHVDGDH